MTFAQRPALFAEARKTNLAEGLDRWLHTCLHSARECRIIVGHSSRVGRLGCQRRDAIFVVHQLFLFPFFLRPLPTRAKGSTGAKKPEAEQIEPLGDGGDHGAGDSSWVDSLFEAELYRG